MAAIDLYEILKVIGLIVYYYFEAFIRLVLPKPKKNITNKLVVINWCWSRPRQANGN